MEYLDGLDCLDPVEFLLLQRLREGGTLASLFAQPTERRVDKMGSQARAMDDG